MSEAAASARATRHRLWVRGVRGDTARRQQSFARVAVRGGVQCIAFLANDPRRWPSSGQHAGPAGRGAGSRLVTTTTTTAAARGHAIPRRCATHASQCTRQAGKTGLAPALVWIRATLYALRTAAEPIISLPLSARHTHARANARQRPRRRHAKARESQRWDSPGTQSCAVEPLVDTVSCCRWPSSRPGLLIAVHIDMPIMICFQNPNLQLGGHPNVNLPWSIHQKQRS